MYLCYVLLFIPPLLGLIFSIIECLWVSRIKINGPEDKVDKMEDGLVQVDKMKEIAFYIAEGANAFLTKEYQYLTVFIIVFSVLLALFVSYFTAISFVLGCLTSILCGYIGMKIAVYANVRTTNETWKSLDKGFKVTLNAGTVMGFSLVSFSIIALGLLIYVYKTFFFKGAILESSVYKVIAGFGLGGSSIALFSRVGGGIYTKAADVGADLSGKNEYGIPEDDIRNPACIADNVGDNVGDMAGMGADLFGSLAESLCAALVIGSSVLSIKEGTGANINHCIMYPLTFCSASIIVSMITFFIVTKSVKVTEKKDVEKTLKYLLFVSTILQSIAIVVIGYFSFPLSVKYNVLKEIQRWKIIVPALVGLWSGLIIGFTTEFYTSYSFSPVQEIANTQKVSAATGIIYGLSLGYKSTFIPIICLSATLGISYGLCDTYGIALAAVGMLSTLCICLTIDAYGPISDNAGGIAEMAGLPSEVRARTDILDAAGNTTAAIGKGFAIGSAALVAFALFGAYASSANLRHVNILNPWVIIGLLIGAMLPYLFSALTMKSVAIAANSVLNECLAQFPLILADKQKPDYDKCIKISTDASLRQMIVPGLISVFSPLIIGGLMGKYATAGLLVGIILSGIQLAFSSTNSGGAWDNAKKYIESGALGTEHCKGSSAHKNSVIGDTVGDPLKDTSGPSLNILIKLSAITSLVFAGVIANNFTSRRGGPIWL
ncbi:V-type H(+)-translocating pyrophosphatase, putative [Plasmodium knowlesi strain H]|uniref:H(+)-exporting diphosphatase n=3 Tax=Plasmodium knowlesi TaxID=5850 RepID=A0A5K1UPQ9_PLAKH|nr:V-type H(+)-translocating pyrophosphatase, putative [Plasmodium knowlesi strain H]OTN65423.1 putative V-type H(+)-translocating pyrophosphatase [Plasmodium knowlesi]CAA9989578.1 V-type H(+)-translocating pyrophosphatase, putative [Plasmodium knowlesi strain H]SBO22626.1 V-type H(+)-translocating pyrophosphatase, putative [Plasmodium knowlesi strain H]SBO23438.1 V-type H(+)-translocating pyrophosphatase, putative [Plasmodium knowlesi strain H]VVS79052.1 V-type H(+)-translocating pyrophosphat|eukprot:XP_002260303.1 V-type H(+)-translocating pyrophosphatase,putative [Plasmodium knowlesi strain H]